MFGLRGRAQCWRVSWMTILIKRCCDNTAHRWQHTRRSLDFTMEQKRQHEKQKLLGKSRDAHEESWIDLSTKALLPRATLAIRMFAENYLHLQRLRSKKTLKCSGYCSNTGL
jgi:hypothetical protein